MVGAIESHSSDCVRDSSVDDVGAVLCIVQTVKKVKAVWEFPTGEVQFSVIDCSPCQPSVEYFHETEMEVDNKEFVTFLLCYSTAMFQREVTSGSHVWLFFPCQIGHSRLM